MLNPLQPVSASNARAKQTWLLTKCGCNCGALMEWNAVDNLYSMVQFGIVSYTIFFVLIQNVKKCYQLIGCIPSLTFSSRSRNILRDGWV